MAILFNRVAELQGLYGPFTMAERIVQKIWLRQDFVRENCRLTDGRPLVIRSTGSWNLLAGPDFLGARLLVAGREVYGDVEVHFHASDWRDHGHETDPAYANVVLHVVLFPPEPTGAAARRADGAEIPTFVLLPLLHRDLEEYASDDTLETITARDEWERFAALAGMAGPERRVLLRQFAEQRWQQKVHFARLKLAGMDWTAAAHHTVLEILGYRQNRGAMLTVAARYPLAAWAAGVDPELLLKSEAVHWLVNGVRPANHPLARLRQYQHLVAALPDWPARLQRLSGGLAGAAAGVGPTRTVRRQAGFGLLRRRFADEVLAGTVGGSRLDNLVCDGFLPLLAARSGAQLWPVWFHWFLGDLPDQLRRTLARLGLAGDRLQPHCHGLAQGLLGWILHQEARASGLQSKNLPGA